MVDKELDETIKRVEQEKKRALKKKREADAKQDIRKKMSVIAATAIDDDADLTLDKKVWEKVRAVEPEDLHKYLPSKLPDEEEEMDPLERKYKFFTDGGANHLADEAVSDGSISEDEQVTHVDRMA